MQQPRRPPKPRLGGARSRKPATASETGGTTIENREQNKATARILTVLSSFASNIREFGISELSQHLGMTKNMVFRAVKTLVEQDYIVRDVSGQRYQLGFRVLELQNTASPEPTFRTLCAPYILQIHELTGETVSLNVRALDYMVFIDGIETRKPAVWRLQIGALRPLHATASGQVLLAFLADTEIEGYVARQHKRAALDGAQNDNPMNADRLWNDIRTIRIRGYAEVLRHAPLPNLSISFPIWDAENNLHGVMSVGGPNERFGPQVQVLLPRLLEIMESLCHRTRLYSANVAGSEITL
jgi:IclR family KDG regulon transcriptional repressor